MPYFIYTETKSCFFHFSFHATLFFSPNECILLELFIKHKPLFSEECYNYRYYCIFILVVKYQSLLINLKFLLILQVAATNADLALINSGTFRSDMIHSAGPFFLKDLLKILPMIDPLVLLEVTGNEWMIPQRARKFKKVQAKKLVKPNKSTKNFFREMAFLAVLNFFPL